MIAYSITLIGLKSDIASKNKDVSFYCFDKIIFFGDCGILLVDLGVIVNRYSAYPCYIRRLV
jgi:hypothetical protein